MTEQEKILPTQTPYKRRLSDMLDLTYELEGLLHIGVTRTEVPQRLNQLIVAKLNALVALADNPATPEELAIDGIAYSLEEEDDDPDFIPKPLFNDTEVIDEERSLATDEEELTIEEENEEEPTKEEPEAEEKPRREEPEEDDDEEDKADEESKAEEPSVKDKEVEAPAKQRGVLFSVNDRFLYARELFGGEISNFDRAINEVITLDSYDEAEEYFISEWGFDAERPIAIKFLGTISHLF